MVATTRAVRPITEEGSQTTPAAAFRQTELIPIGGSGRAKAAERRSKAAAGNEVAAPSPRPSAPEADPALLSRGTKKSYTAADIQVLEGIEAIRRRPGMFIGSTSTSGLLHLIWEALDNAIDEFSVGAGKRIWVRIDRDMRVTVRDEGRGIPFDPKEHNRRHLPAATIIMTVPHSGAKFEQGVYKTAGGLHGIGATVINALSAELELTVWSGGKEFRQLFRRGRAEPHSIRPCDPSQHGTQLSWRHDTEIFDHDVHYPRELIASRLQAAAFLNRGVSIELAMWDAEADEMVTETFTSKDGLVEYVKYLLPPDTATLFPRPVALLKPRDGVLVEAALQPNSGYKTAIYSFANGVRTRDGGVHETGFKAAITRVVNDYALKWGVIKDREKDGFRSDVIQQGLVAIVSVKLSNPQFQGQTKDRLNNAPVEGIVRSVTDEGLKEWLEANPERGREWLRRIAVMQKARNEALLAEELLRTGQKKGGELIDTTVSKKFIPCNTKDPERAELFIVEGESAGGSASQARFSDYQGVLKLKGKPLNVARADLKRIVENEEIRTIINVLGCGTRQAFDISRLRFRRIVLLTDADVDGLHIQCLLLTLFFQEFPDVIERGHVYVGCPPLYSVQHKGKTVWLLDDEAKNHWLRQNRGADGLEFRRYKGLGEMTAKQLRETTLDPEKRMLKRVTLEDAAVAARLVSQLMEEGNAEARRNFLARHAREVADVDV